MSSHVCGSGGLSSGNLNNHSNWLTSLTSFFRFIIWTNNYQIFWITIYPISFDDGLFSFFFWMKVKEEYRRQQHVHWLCIPQQTVSSDFDPDTSERGISIHPMAGLIPSRTEAQHSKVWFCWHQSQQPNKIHSHPRPNNMDRTTVLVLILELLCNF